MLMKQMRLRYVGVCRLCGASLPAGTAAIYERETKTVHCLECGTEATETMSNDDSISTESGVAGSSARREYERRKAKDEEELREKWVVSVASQSLSLMSGSRPSPGIEARSVRNASALD